MSVPQWGEWMGGWKAGLEGGKDAEADRIDRQKAAFGAETLAKLKDLNILIIGLRGVGVETAKNLILSNVGAVVVCDTAVPEMRDLGTNFYLSEQHVRAGTPRAEACLPQLKSLNPFCKVEAYSGELSDGYILSKDVNATGKPFAAVIVTQLLPKAELFRINRTARDNNIVFLMAINTGVTASLFSDFGPKHTITDWDGEPTEARALSNIEVLVKPAALQVDGVKDGETIVVLTCDADHGLDDDAEIELDDMQAGLKLLNNRKFKVKRMGFKLHDPKREFTRADGNFQMLMKEGIRACAELWTRQLESRRTEFEAAGNPPEKFKSGIREITLLNRLVLVGVDNADAFGSYQFGGLINPVKEVKIKEYKSLEDSLVRTTAPRASDSATRYPQMLDTEAAYRGDGVDVHLAFAAVLDFQEKEGRWPRMRSKDDADAMLKIATGISDARKEMDGAIWAQTYTEPDYMETFDNQWGVPRDVNARTVGRFSRLFSTELTGFCAYLGGAIAQEVIKRTGKFTPIDQWIHHEDQHLVTDECPSNIGPPSGSRYDDQIAILGKDFQARAADMNVFVVGCGALGCEYLKGLSLMGVATSDRGKVLVTDMDTIETSNLSRQFLFRSTDVGQSKSKSGARVVKEWNPAMNIEGVEQFVGPSTEHIFTDKFWNDLDLCWNALDNVKARQYTDGRCLWYSKPLLESGTTGTKSNSEVILPYRTSTYNDGEDPPEVAIAMCTLRSFPFLPLHCIEFAKQALWTENFEFGPSQYEAFRTNMSSFFSQLDDMPKPSERMEAMRFVKALVDLQKKGAIDFSTCINLGFQQLMTTFRNRILDVIHSGDTTEKREGKPYWTGTKRKPNPVEFSTNDALCMEYLYASANLFAHVFGLEPMRDRAAFAACVEKLQLKQPEWKPSGAQIAEADDEEETVDQASMAALKAELQAVDISKLIEAKPHDFEKDDDDNFHIDYLTIATNLRAWNYNIKDTARHAVKVTAGRIIPALATTTAMVCGLVDIEFCKLVLGLQNLGVSKFLNSNINLATGSEAFSVFNPTQPLVQKTNLAGYDSFTSWDKLEYTEAGRSTAEIVGLLQRDFGVTVRELVAETNYNPPKSVPLWRTGQDGTRLLSQLFYEKMALGEEQSDRSALSKKRAKSELKRLQTEPIESVASVSVKADDDFVFQIKLNGPAGSPYEGGLFLVEVKLPLDYPTAPPTLTFLTPIEHCNILDGVPCPNLLFGSWAPTLTVASVLTQLVLLMKEQSRGDALVPSLAALDEAAFTAKAHESVRKFATADQEFPAVAVKMVTDDTEPVQWPHDYFIVKGDFETPDGDDAALPRIKLAFGGTAAKTAAVAVVPLADDVRAKVMAMELDVDGEKLKPTDCYKLQPERAALFAGIAPGLTAANGAVVTCSSDTMGTVEAIVNLETMEHCKFEDPIMFSEGLIASLVEAQFEHAGPWVLSRGAREGIEQEKGTLFSSYEKMVTMENPECLSTLRKMLQKGPITRLYTGGGNKFVASHEGFALRMPASEVADWQMTNDKGELQDIPRPALALRLWNAETRSYDYLDATLEGAPTTPGKIDAWYVDVVRKLKGSNYIGPELLDKLVTSQKTVSMPKLYERDFDAAFEGTFSNRWTELVCGTCSSSGSS